MRHGDVDYYAIIGYDANSFWNSNLVYLVWCYNFVRDTNIVKNTNNANSTNGVFFANSVSNHSTINNAKVVIENLRPRPQAELTTPSWLLWCLWPLRQSASGIIYRNYYQLSIWSVRTTSQLFDWTHKIIESRFLTKNLSTEMVSVKSGPGPGHQPLLSLGSPLVLAKAQDLASGT